MESLLRDPEIVDDFVTEATERLDRVADLALSVEEGDAQAWDELRRQVHTLKGAAGFVGFDAFSELCHALEGYLLRVADGQVAPEGAFDPVHDLCDLLREWVEQVEVCCRNGTDLPPDARAVEVRTRLAG